MQTKTRSTRHQNICRDKKCEPARAGKLHPLHRECSQKKQCESISIAAPRPPVKRAPTFPCLLARPRSMKSVIPSEPQRVEESAVLCTPQQRNHRSLHCVRLTPDSGRNDNSSKNHRVILRSAATACPERVRPRRTSRMGRIQTRMAESMQYAFSGFFASLRMTRRCTIPIAVQKNCHSERAAASRGICGSVSIENDRVPHSSRALCG